MSVRQLFTRAPTNPQLLSIQLDNSPSHRTSDALFIACYPRLRTACRRSIGRACARRRNQTISPLSSERWRSETRRFPVTQREKFETKKLPMMPIRDVVIFPFMMTPFVVGRESSVRALEEALAGDKK